MNYDWVDMHCQAQFDCDADGHSPHPRPFCNKDIVHRISFAKLSTVSRDGAVPFSPRCDGALHHHQIEAYVMNLMLTVRFTPRA